MTIKETGASLSQSQKMQAVLFLIVLVICRPRSVRIGKKLCPRT